jgi:hypothetical protein
MPVSFCSTNAITQWGRHFGHHLFLAISGLPNNKFVVVFLPYLVAPIDKGILAFFASP